MLTGAWKRAFGRRDLFLVTLDALRHDVAVEALASGQMPNLAALIPGGFEARHTPATFTYAAHHAFFAGFLPTPRGPGRHARPFAMRFSGSRSISADTLVLDAPDLITGARAAGYHTICIGGTQFFDPGSPLGGVLPALFDEAHWSPATGVTSRSASGLQLGLAARRLAAQPADRRVLLFVNAAATHPPTRIFVPGARAESPATQRAALIELDRHLPVLIDAMRARGGAVGVVCSDHGTCFGDDGRTGHRFAHDAVWTVPYAEIELEGAA